MYIVYIQKKLLSDIFSLAQMRQEAWEKLLEVNKLFQKGNTKDQKVKGAEAVRGQIVLKEWHFKHGVSL